MKLKNFFWTGEILTAFFWVVFFLILNATEPKKAGMFIFVLFYLVLFAAIMGTVGLLEFRLSLKYKGSEKVKNKIFNSSRHGFMTALVLVGILFMRGIDVLTWWDGSVFVAAILLFEAYFMTRGNIVSETK